MEENKNKNMNDELEKLDESETDKVSGGYLGLGNDAPDGHEENCIACYHISHECKISPDGLHFVVKNEDGDDVCKYCGFNYDRIGEGVNPTEYNY